MGKYIVLDIVFYGNSLNYDQGSGNYQELKKITKWDGKQHTLVSRYALRYSLLETAKKFYNWDLADGNKLSNAGNSTNSKVIQPSNDLLLSGEILNYPEFDLFGYLITSTKPQNFRTAPVKISHAISMTPFNHDALFNANIGLANRVRKYKGELTPNPFITEEHETFYQYTIVIDVDNIGKLEVYLKKDAELECIDGKKKIEIDENGIKFKDNENTIDKSDKVNQEITSIDTIYTINFELNDIEYKKKRIVELIETIFCLKRSIKAREEDLSPKLVIVGVYDNKPYQTYKDRICLLDEHVEEGLDEIKEFEENGNKIVQVKHKTTKSKSPIFEIVGINENKECITSKTEKISSFIESFLKNDISEKCKAQLKIYHDPTINISYKND